ncbi:transposase [Novosphingobium sp. Rr 2-17]|nr:transposase [Novosphingobium sp. Rr 2-17]
MLKHPTLDLLGQLGLAGMAKAFTEMATNDDAASLTMPNGWPCYSIMRSHTEILSIWLIRSVRLSVETSQVSS